YAYTLWSIGTTYKMLREGEKAAQYFFKANKLFVETGDTRGRLYVQQGLHEVICLTNSKKTVKHILHLLQHEPVRSKEFHWENLHEYFLSQNTLIQGKKTIAESKLHFFGGENFRKDLENAKKEEKLFLKTIKKAYQSAGSRFYPKSIPVNWP
ncbi:MAG TPA: hypothetical protein VK791_04505, partial [bacterium]|nr:hypothetical protein [bacterium]